MRKAVSMVLVLAMCLSLCACGTNGKVKQLMSGLEWGQNEAQVGKRQSELDNPQYYLEICGKETPLSLDYVQGFDDEGKLREIRYTFKVSGLYVEGDVDERFDTKFNALKENLIELLGTPDDSLTRYCIWYVGDDIITLDHESKVENGLFNALWDYRIAHLTIKHTA